MKGPSCDVDNCLETPFSFVSDVTSIKHPEHGFNWERFSFFTRYKRVVAFMLRMLPSHGHFCLHMVNFTWSSTNNDGGSWERLVRSVKRVLYDIIGNRRVTEEVLETTLCLVEQALSSRPITPVSTDSLKLEALTPNHLLQGLHARRFPSLLPGEHFEHKKRYGLAGFAKTFHY